MKLRADYILYDIWGWPAEGEGGEVVKEKPEEEEEEEEEDEDDEDDDTVVSLIYVVRRLLGVTIVYLQMD